MNDRQFKRKTILRQTKTFEIDPIIVRQQWGHRTICIPKRLKRKARSLPFGFRYPKLQKPKFRVNQTMLENSCYCDQCGAGTRKLRLVFSFKEMPKKIPEMRRYKRSIGDIPPPRAFMSFVPQSLSPPILSNVRRSFQLAENSPVSQMKSSGKVSNSDIKMKTLSTFKKLVTETHLTSILMKMVQSSMKLEQSQKLEVPAKKESPTTSLREIKLPESIVIAPTSPTNEVKSPKSFRIRTEASQHHVDYAKRYFLAKYQVNSKLSGLASQTIQSNQTQSYRKSLNYTPNKLQKKYQDRLSNRILSTYFKQSPQLKRNLS